MPNVPTYKWLDVVLFLLILSFNNPSFASCPPLTSPRAVVECALAQNPGITLERARVSQGHYLEDQAGQLPNPEFGTRAVFGKLLGANQSIFETNLTQTFELGGKRDARIERARAENEGLMASLQKSKEEVFISTFKSLYRLRQIVVEIKILNDALSLFSKQQKQYKSRKKLGPEQEVSFGVITLAEGDYRLRRTALESDKSSIIRNLSFSIGQEFKISEATLPPRPTSWPKTKKERPETFIHSSSLMLASSELKLAHADLSAAQGHSWPDLKLGPSFESQSQGWFVYQTFGANLTFAIPLFQMNGAGRDYARQGLERAETSYFFHQKEGEMLRANWSEKYERIIQALAQSISSSEIEKKQRSMVGLFTRGLLPSSLVIEAQRQIFDFTRSQNELELAAIESYCRIRALDGNIFEEFQGI